MYENDTRRLTIAPRHPRVLHSGPRVRLMETMLVLHVAVVFLAGFLSWLLIRKGSYELAATLAGGAGILLVIDLVRLRQLRRLRHLALHGLITQGHITGSRLCRLPRAPRADGALPRGGLPFVAGLEVGYGFEDEDGRTHEGRFLTSRNDGEYYEIGRRHEVFFLRESPETNASSLVIRWYYRLGGPAMTDEAPPEDFPLDQDVLFEEIG
ncbi:MAG: hypothetical protein CMJ83_19920 [Planctomycetes bacterium]|nr:hypothetical protein [Planctomycetota bacterium]